MNSKQRRKALARYLSVAWRAYEMDWGLEYANRKFIDVKHDVFWDALAERIILAHIEGRDIGRRELIKELKKEAADV